MIVINLHIIQLLMTLLWKSGGFTGFARCLSFCNVVIPEYFFFHNSLRMNGQNLANFCIYIIIGGVCVGVVDHCFSQISNRVTALVWH